MTRGQEEIPRQSSAARLTTSSAAMNALLRQARCAGGLGRLARSYATTSAPYVPPASMRDVQHRDQRDQQDEKTKPKVKPDSPSFYTGRAGYYDTLLALEEAIDSSSRALRQLALLPLPDFARQSLPALQPVWKAQADMTAVFSSTLSTTRYRRALALLAQLSDHRRIARAAGVDALADEVDAVLSMFERADREAYLNRGKRKPVGFDAHGRTYTVGKRKTSAARVWMIPAKPTAQPAPSAVPAPAPDAPMPSILDLGKAPAVPEAAAEETVGPDVLGSILVNNVPLATYFPVPADRERIVRPFKLAGLLGAFNVFALVRGGGTTGQSGAVMHGIAKGLAAHVPDVSIILRRCEAASASRSKLSLTTPLQRNSSGAIRVWSSAKRPASRKHGNAYVPSALLVLLCRSRRSRTVRLGQAVERAFTWAMLTIIAFYCCCRH
jgi:small subunit ribosomal protein S9